MLDGHKSMVVPDGDSADMLIVSARTSGERRDKSGITLFLLDAGELPQASTEIHGYLKAEDAIPALPRLR